VTLSQAFFGYFAAAMTVLSLLVVTRRNPVHSVLWMLVLFVHIAGLYLFLNAEFLAAIQIIVYAGAILVLFLFVIMLLNLKKEESASKYLAQWPVAATVGLALAVLMIFVLRRFEVVPSPGPYSIDMIKSQGSIMTTGKVLYTGYLLPFEVASVVLLVAIIGAVVLAKRRI
jgi:NADH-quinone oxidoreductase subunit J